MIKECGTYQEVFAKKGETFQLIKEYGKKRKISDELIPERQPSATPVHSRLASIVKEVINTKEDAEEGDKLILKEESAKGSVSWEVYKVDPRLYIY